LKPADSIRWYQLAPVLLEMGDLSGYQTHRHEALERFAKPDSPMVAERVARLALLTPLSGADLEAALRLAEIAGAAEYADGDLPWRQLAQGLAEYRRGRLTNAVEWVRKARNLTGQRTLPGWSHEMERNVTAATCFVEGLACHQMHDSVTANSALHQGIRTIQTQFPPSGGGDLGRNWPDCLIAQLLLREASETIH